MRKWYALLKEISSSKWGEEITEKQQGRLNRKRALEQGLVGVRGCRTRPDLDSVEGNSRQNNRAHRNYSLKEVKKSKYYRAT